MEKRKCRCEVITCLFFFFYLPALRLPFVSHHLWHEDELSAVSPDQKGDPGVGDTLTRYSCSPSWIMEQGLHLNDKQNDLETPRGSLAPAPPCLHAKKKKKLTIMQNEAPRIFLVSRELIRVSPRHVGQLWVRRSNCTLLMPCSVCVLLCLSSPADHFHLQSSPQNPVFSGLA